MDLPTSVKDWQLYNIKGAGRAAATMTRVLKKSLLTIERMVSNGSTIVEAATKVSLDFYTTQSKLSKFGAYDTEPEWVKVNALVKFCVNRYDVDAYDIRSQLS